MPTTYAHYTFGKEVLKYLDDEIREIIAENIELYNIGVHGPDILFYYGPLKSNRINKIGNEIHGKKAAYFFENAKKIICECSDIKAACSYAMGFICHFMLDSECHPYIRQKEKTISHGEIETEFDRALMIKNGFNPISYKPTSHIISKIDYAKCISGFYENISYNEILESLKSMKICLDLLVAPGRIKRAIIINALRLTGNNDKIGLIMRYEPNPKCEEINVKLTELYSDAIMMTTDIINEFYKNLYSKHPLNERFNRSFE